MKNRFFVAMAAVLGVVSCSVARTVDVVAQTAKTVTLEFGEADGRSYSLFLAHGTVDQEDMKHSWTGFAPCGLVAATETRRVLEVPANLRDGRYLRFFLLQTDGTACAQELKCVRSTSKQYIDIGSLPNSGRLCCDFRFGDVTYANNTAFFGQNWKATQYLFNQQKNVFYFHSGGTNTGISPTSSTDFRVLISEGNMLEIRNPTTAVKRFGSIGRGLDANVHLAIFGCINGGSLSTYRFDRLKFSNYGTLMRDFIPAKNAAGVVGLYDQVHDRFYSSNTSTSLVAGDPWNDGRDGRVIDETITFRFHRALTVTSVTADAVTFAFDNPDGAVYDLCVASGTTDQNDAKNAWANFATVTTLTAKQTTYTYTLPAELKASGTFYRFFLMKTTDLPYTAEVASLTSTGVQTIDAGFIPSTRSSFDITLAPTSYVNDRTYFGQGYNGNAFLLCSQNNGFAYYGNNGCNSGIYPTSGVTVRARSNERGEVVVDSPTARAMFYEPNLPQPSGQSVSIFNTMLQSAGACFRLDALKFLDAGFLVRDFIPVIANGKGALFDRVRGTLHTNWHATDFTKGATLARTGWVVDTSATYAAGATAAVDAWWQPVADSVSVDGNAVTLTADSDWSSVLTAIPASTEVDLNGHTLRINSGTTETCEPFTVKGSGTLELTVPAGQNFRGAPVVPVLAKVALVKKGAGTLTAATLLNGVTSIDLVEGKWVCGGNNMISTTIPVTVRDGTTFDFAGKSGFCAIFTIIGTGVDGKGALYNSGAAGTLGSTTAQNAGIILAGDATVGSTSHIGLINKNNAATTLELNGHTLTVNVKIAYGFWLVNTTGSSSGTILVQQGVLYPYNSSYAVSLPNVDVVLDGANAIYRSHSNGSSKMTFRDMVVKNGGSFENISNKTYLRNLDVYDTSLVPNKAAAWIYLSNQFTVSNETGTITIYPPICGNGTYAQLVKQGAGTLTISNNYTDQRMHRGVDVQGGTVVMSATRGGDYAHVAVSSTYAPYTVRKGATLDMSQCTKPVLVSMLTVEDGATLTHATTQTIAVKNTFTTTEPFYFDGSVRADGLTFNLDDLFRSVNAPKKGDRLTLFRAGKLLAGGTITVLGCPYDYEIVQTDTSATLHILTGSETTPAAIKICTMGGPFAYEMTADGVANCSFRGDLAQALTTEEGWNVQMTGWRSDLRFSSGATGTQSAWAGHSGATDHALKTSALHAGILEGLEDFCSAAGEPDFTLFICGDVDVKDGVADATIFANWTNAISRIKSALPMTTVVAATIPGASTALNTQIADWCANEADVESVDLTAIYTTTNAPTQAQLAATAAAFKTKLVTLATKDGKNTPSTWVRPAVTLGATNNVPAAYLDGYTLIRVIDLPQQACDWRQQPNALPYTYAPIVQTNGISKVGYYIELVNKTTGELKALWVDMDAPGPTLNDITIPVSGPQYKQQPVTNLHVWANTRAVTQVPADDNTVLGYIEFNNADYTATERNPTGGIADPFTGVFGFDDTMKISTGNGHGCFQIMRKFADTTRVPAGEVLYTFTGWGGSTATSGNGVGIGTFASYGNLGFSGNKELDRTFTRGGSTSEAANISSWAYSTSRISIYVQYAATPAAVDRATAADASWTGATNSEIWNYANWQTHAGANPTSFDFCTWRLPEDTTVDFVYSNVDGVTHWATTLMIDGTANFPKVGGFRINSLDVGPTGVLCFDPTEFSWSLRAAPIFREGGKFRLPAKYATATKGRFLLFIVDQMGDVTAADYANAFDTASAAGTNPKITVEKRANGQSYIWLDLAYGAPRETINVLCVGDSITQGYDSTYGNWRTLLAKKIEALGYNANMKGYWTIQSGDINKQVLPDEWCRHAGISGQRIITAGGAGTLDAIEATLDQAGDCDFILVKLGTNDINSQNTETATLFPAWKELITKILDQKPHAKVVAGAVVDIAYNAAKNTIVTNFNDTVQKAIAGGMFPAGRTFFSDLYTPCYRYDADGNYITGSFYASNNLHPDWPGEVKMAETYLATMTNAIATADAEWQLNAHETVTATTTGVTNNVSAADRAGFKLARVFDVAGNNGVNLYTLGYVPYEATRDASAATTNIARVGYYIELTRKDGAGSTYDGLTRWLWVTLDAFGDRTIETVGVPLHRVYQGTGANLRVKTNMPGIANTSDRGSDTGWIEFWPDSYYEYSSGIVGAPAHVWNYDWNSSRVGDLSGFGSMQIHRLTPGKRNAAQTLFAFNRWTVAGGYDVGLGNFANQVVGSMDWTFTGDSRKGMFDTMAPNAYSVARIEIWTMGGDDTATTGAWLEVTGFTTEGDVTTVTGEVGDFTLFGEDATSATVTLEWSTDPTFATVTGSQDLGTVTEQGRIEGKITGLGTGPWYYRFRATNDAGASDTSRTSAADTGTVATWRPQTTSDTWQSDAWLANGTGTPVAFSANWTALFDGEETAKPSAVTLEQDTDAASVIFNAATDYTLGGAGTLKTGTFVKKGTGTLTLEKAVLGRTKDIMVEQGVVKLGDTAVKGAAGVDGGTITVKNGAQFELNFTGSGADAARATVTSKKKFVIEGAGPDGKGALLNTSGNTTWSNPLDEVVLTGDATIGGTGRLDMRANAKNSITGPTNAVLTLANNSIQTIGINVHGPIQVGRVDITKGSMLTLENTTTEIDAPLGLNLYGALNIYSCTPKWHDTLVRAKGDGAAMGANGGTSFFNGALEVESGATLTLNLASTLRYTGSITNNGTMKTTAGGHWFMPSNFLAGADAKFQVTGGNTYFVDTGDWSEADMVLQMTAGQFWWGHYDYGSYPQPKSLDVSGVTKGSMVFCSNRDAQVPATFAQANPETVYILNSANDVQTTLAPGSYNIQNRLKLANAIRPGNLKLTDGVTVTANQLYFGDDAKTARRGYLEVGPGATMNVKSTTWIGHYPDAGEGHHLVLAGGTFNHLGTSEGVRIGVDALKSYFDHNAGTANVTGLRCRREYEQPWTYEERYTLNGGTLNLGSLGLAGFTRYQPFVEFNNGTVNATADFSVEQLRSVSFGNEPDGQVDFNIADKTINWQTGLRGQADVTLRGTGTFKSGLNTSRTKMRIQGVPTGHWTIANTGANNLYGAAGFAGGLTLEENVTANLNIAGSNLIECAFLQGSPYADAQRVSSLPFAVNDMSMLNARGDANDYTSSSIVWQGEFYCDTAGTWTFGGTYDDNEYLAIDGKQVFSSASASKTAAGTVALTVGWHEFRIVQYQGKGSWGASPSGFVSAGFNIGFAKSSVDGNTASNLTKFDAANLPMRPSRLSKGANGLARWSSAKCSNKDNFASQTDLTDNGRFRLSDLHTYRVVATPTFSAQTHEFTGSVYVTAEQAGYWSATLSWDDRILMEIDGKDAGQTRSTTATGTGFGYVGEGWHTFRIRVADGSGGWGPWNACGYYCRITVNGNMYLFDERYFQIQSETAVPLLEGVEHAGLDKTVEIKKGATLQNDATGAACPIWGVLKGAGKLVGKFAFTGRNTCYVVSGTGRKSAVENRIDFSGVTNADALADLQAVQATFDQKPGCAKYDIGAACGMDVTKLALAVTDKDGNDYSENFTAEVENSRLILKNAHPSGMVLFLR